MTSVFTYTLGKSLYIPLTSKCNSLSLPVTRGVNFKLPNAVISALLHVRLAEISQSDDVTIAEEYLRIFEKEGNSLLPPNPQEILNWEGHDFEGKLSSFPSTKILFEEAKSYIESEYHTIDSIVFAGEGEPTLRMESLKKLTFQLNDWMKSNYQTKSVSIRIVTNGLVLCKHPHKQSLLRNLKHNGVTNLSIAVMSPCKAQYENLIKPLGFKYTTSDELHPHSMVCQLVKDAVEIGFEVELTGVAHDFIDESLANDFAAALGASFRFRPYFP